MTVILPADPGAIAHAADLLRHGGLVAFPTETVYGLGANALDPDAVRRIFDAKGRPAYNPVIVHVPDAAAARALASEWPPEAERLAAAFWPGPVTLVVPKRPVVPDLVTAGRAAVALRVPSHPVALALLRAAGVPVAAPSANRSTEVSPTSAAHVHRSLDGRVDLILDAGPTEIGIESAVVDLTGDHPALLRPGSVGSKELERYLGPLQPPPSVSRPDAPRPSPGLLDRHYAPRAELRAARSPAEARALLQRATTTGSTGVLVHSFPDLPADHLVRLPTDPAGYGRGLYAALHTFDDLGCVLVVIEPVPAGAAWDGIRDRLTRAATPLP
jgi:L-threonylcarbamoyladenylate synthase